MPNNIHRAMTTPIDNTEPFQTKWRTPCITETLFRYQKQ